MEIVHKVSEKCITKDIAGISMTNLNPTASPSGTKAYKMTSSVTSRDSPKKIKIYMDEDLEVEAGLIQERIQERREDQTKGPEIGNYHSVYISWKLVTNGVT